MMWFVYILLCQDGSFYIGSTNNVKKRLSAHLLGKGCRYTKSHPVKKLVYQEACLSKSDALKREIALKQLPKEKKQALINRLYVSNN